jgi:hypothetical protein
MLVVVFALGVAGWLFWSWPQRVDMAAYLPADCLGFIEANDLVELADGISNTEAWTKLAAPLGAKSSLVPNRWLIRLARWTGIGSSDAILLARSQFAFVFTDIQRSEVGPTLNVKPVASLIIETHTLQIRMRPAIERHVEDFARFHGLTSLVRKQIEGADLADWSSPDGTRHIIATFVRTTAIIGNDESSVLKCVGVHNGKTAPLSGSQELSKMRQQLNAAGAPLFGYITKFGVKPALTAWALDRFKSSPNTLAVVPIIAETITNLIDGFGWTAQFTDRGTEDHFLVSLSEGVADQLRSNIVPDVRASEDEAVFVPTDAYSFSTYHFHDTDGAWRDLNAVVSSHSSVVGAVVTHQALQALFPPYGINDPDMFLRSVGTRLQTIRLEDNAPSALVADAFDRPGLRKSTEKTVDTAAKSENLSDAEFFSSSNGWAESFAGSRFLIGPSEQLRTSLQARSQNQSLSSVDAYKRAQKLVDVSMPIIVLTFTDDRRSAISFIELFTRSERPAFSINASTIEGASRSLPYAVSVTMLKENGFEWTSRSSFGLLGSFAVKFLPGTYR